MANTLVAALSRKHRNRAQKTGGTSGNRRNSDLLFPPRREHFRVALLLVRRRCCPVESSGEDGESEGAAGTCAPGGREARRGGSARPCAPSPGAGPPTSLGGRSGGKGEVRGVGRPGSGLR